MIFLKSFMICIVGGVFLLCSFSSASTYRDQETENIVRTIPAADMLPLQNNLFQILKNKPSLKISFIIHHQASEVLDVLLFTVYQENNFFPYWVTKSGPTRKARLLLSVLGRADEEGLNPEHYRVRELKGLLAKKESQSLAKLDIMLSAALYLYLGDILEGAAPRCLLQPDIFADARFTVANQWVMLRKAVKAPDLRLFLHN
ncbi:MAG: hypothetical protein D3904_01615, partial [Candidatus Electrothrix sp. EH2]|nr:hypothetical protein [Candidatus Electrothrix sp. EH2]